MTLVDRIKKVSTGLILAVALAGCTTSSQVVPIKQSKPTKSFEPIRPLILTDRPTLEGIYVGAEFEVVRSEKFLHVYATPRNVEKSQLFNILMDNFDAARDGLVLTKKVIEYHTQGKVIALKPSKYLKHAYITADGGLGFSTTGFECVVNSKTPHAIIEHTWFGEDILENQGKGAVELSIRLDNNRGWNTNKFVAVLNVAADPLYLRNGVSAPYQVDSSQVKEERDALVAKLEPNGSLAMEGGTNFSMKNALVHRGGLEISCGNTPVQVISAVVYNPQQTQQNHNPMIVLSGRGKYALHNVKANSELVINGKLLNSVVAEPETK
ncbi:MAG: hypothetical protein Q7K43_06565 [Candidatus Woesearchaeota archaeon]|nr:hypothetical protein [Candidatus Woesearchaeota archaeon]